MIDVIADTLKQSFPDTEIYIGESSQAEGSVFYIRVLEGMQEKRIGNRYARVCSFVIRYHSRENQSSTGGGNIIPASYETADKLYDVLEFMESGDRILRGYDMKHLMEDNALLFFITCRQSLKRQKSEPLMEELQTRVEEKG